MLENLLSTINSRVPYPVLGRVLHKHNIPTTKGFEPTIEKVKDFANESSTKRNQVLGIIPDLKAVFLNGNKSIRLYSLTDQLLREIFQKIDAITVVQTQFSQKYPLILNTGELNNIPANDLFLVEKQKTNEEILLIFCCKRVVRKNIDIAGDLSTLTGGSAIANQYSKVIGVKIEAVQYFDVIRINKKQKIVTLEIDYFDKACSEKQEDLAHRNLFMRFCSEFDLTSLNYTDSINVFPKMRSLYNNYKSGSVVEIGIMLDTGFIIRTKSRRQENDVRKDEWHVAGRKKVKGIFFIFNIALTWDKPSERGYQLELFIKGKQSHKLIPNPVIDKFYFSYCFEPADFKVLISKIIS